MNPDKSPLARRSGFTLIEVILALTIFALMGTILYGAFSLGHGAAEKVQTSFEQNQKLRAFGDLLGGYVRSSFPYRISLQEPTVFFVGGETDLSFVSSYSLAMGGRGMAKVRLFWDGAASGEGALRLEEETPVRFPEESEGGGSGGHSAGVVLLEGVTNFRLAYLDPQSEDELWLESWNGKDRHMLPRAVRLSYRVEGGREIRWTFPVMMSVLAP